MFYLVRKSVVGNNSEYQDFDFDSKDLTFGTGEKNTIILHDVSSGRLRIIAKNTREAIFDCNEDLSIGFSDKTYKKGKLAAGNIYKLDVYDLEIVVPPSGFNFALKVTKTNRQPTSTSQPYLAKRTNKFKFRTLAYLSSVIILSLFLLLPILSSNNTSIKNILKDTPLPSDHSWLSGPLAKAHRIPEIGDNCNVCHDKFFEKTPDVKCLNCHKNLGEHISVTNKAIDNIHEYLCQNCHKEHNEPSRITRDDDTLCVDCHQNINEFDTQSSVDVKKVSGFNQELHPEFRLSLLKPKGDGASLGWEVSRPLFSDELKEQSNIKFSHLIHLDADKVQNQSDGEVLSCPACHQLKEDGKHFEPMTMDKDCRSCHKLTFDVFNPDLELPHGNLRSATVALQAHYIREFTDPNLRKKRARIKPRRVPGKNPSNATCVGTGLDCGRKEALKEAEFQFSKSGCITCHNVIDNGGNDIIAKWFVQPINITNDWYQKSLFDHKSHLSVSGSNQQQICLSCHKVDTSDDAEDILIPQRENCLQCHQQGAKHSVELNCINCHVFHFTKNIIGEEQ